MSDKISGYTLFCEDIRTEQSGKKIFIGVFTGNIQVPSFPADIQLQTVTFLRRISQGEHVMELSIKFPDGENLTLTGDLEVKTAEANLTIESPQTVVHCKEPGTIQVLFSLDNEPHIQTGNILLQEAKS